MLIDVIRFWEEKNVREPQTWINFHCPSHHLIPIIKYVIGVKPEHPITQVIIQQFDHLNTTIITILNIKMGITMWYNQ